MYNSKIHHRHSIRIKDYDYSQIGMYFITICTHEKKKILSNIKYDTTNVGAHDCAQNTTKPNCNTTNVGAHDCAPKDYKIRLSKIGLILEKELKKTNKINTNINICNYVIMPNHIHMIIEINGVENKIRRGAQSCAPTENKKTIGDIVRGIKSSVSCKIGYSIWQRNYYEHVIRNEKEYNAIVEYIQNNPYNWINDKYYI